MLYLLRMAVKMFFTVFVVIFLTFLFISGCWSYKELEKFWDVFDLITWDEEM